MLPKKWCIQLNKKNREVILQWCDDNWLLGDKSSYKTLIGNYYIHSDNPEPSETNGYKRGTGSFFKADNYTEITFEEFEKYVLNKTPETKEDMSYLIKVLKRCNIK